MDIEETKKCPKCLIQILAPYAAHYEAPNPCLLSSGILKKTDKFVCFQDGTYACMRCLKSFENQGKWSYHKKKIRLVCEGFQRYSQNPFTPEKGVGIDDEKMENSLKGNACDSSNRKTMKSINKNSIANLQSSYRKIIDFSLVSETTRSKQQIKITKQLSLDELTALMLLDIFVAQSKIVIISWVTNNNQIGPIFLQYFFTKFIDQFLKKLGYQIPIPSFQTLKKHLRINWQEIIEDPFLIFDQENLQQSLRFLPPTKKIKVLKAINSIYHHQYFDAFPKFTVKYTPLSSRQLPPLRTVDLFEIIEKLFSTKRKCYVHIAIDLYLIFQSGQRFHSDRENIEHGISELLQVRKTQAGVCQLEMKISKNKRFTDKKSRFLLSEQLCQLLEYFGWTGFFKKGTLYQRMFLIFGFPVYQIKKCLFSEIKLQENGAAKFAMRELADHRNEKTTRIYSKGGDLGRIKIVKDLLKVPNLTIESITKEQFLSIIGEFPSSLKYLKINFRWFELLSKKIANQDMTEMNFYHDNQTNLGNKPNNGNIITVEEDEKGNPITVQKQLNLKQKAEDLAEEVKILQNNYQMVEGKFVLADHFVSSKISYCSVCNIEGHPLTDSNNQLKDKECLFCTANYHLSCMPKFCECLTYKKENGVRCNNNTNKQKSNIRLVMPSSYFGQEWENLDQIKFLLAGRRFYYTSVAAVLDPAYLIRAEDNISSTKLDKLILPRFQEYCSGYYFPPLELKVSGFQTISGTGFGLFATEDISRLCFIGQYAADILTQKYSLQIKRPDSIMTLIPGERPDRKVIIGPVKRCGYVCLINGVSETQANCEVLTVEIDKFMRIILYTKQPIKKGEELLYNYDRQSKFQHSTLQNKQTSEKGEQDKNKKIMQIKANKTKQWGLVNFGNTCYMNSVFQFFRLMMPEHAGRKTWDQVSSTLDSVISGIGYNQHWPLRQQIQQFEKVSNLFKIGQQQDAHQFLHFLLSHLSTNAQKDIKVVIKTTLTCNTCHFIKDKFDEVLTYMIECQKNIGDSVLLQQKIQQLSDYQCLNCLSKGTIQEKTVIGKFPKKLIVLIKRFDSNLRKKTTKIDNKGIGSGLYRLVCIISHRGKTIASGHYLTIEFLNDKQMVVYNDDIVTVKRFSEEEAYILGFQKIE